MKKYNVVVAQSAEKVLYQLPKEVIPRITLAMQSLADNPYPVGCRKMSGEENTFRIRVQNYRIVYEVHKKTITIIVLKIGHRKDVYR